MPRVSVIIPSYRHASFIEECVRSALAQTLEDIEVIVVDDCGGDSSVELLRAIDDPRLRVYENSVNLGTYQTQNVALSHATGEWIAVLNSDDRWHPTKLARQLSLLQETGLDWCYTLGRQIDAAGASLPLDQHCSWPHDSVQDLSSLLLVSNRILASSVVFRRGHSLLGELRYCGDWMLALRLALGGLGAFVDEPLTDWRQHGANSYLPSDKLVAEEILVRMSLAAWAGRHPVRGGEAPRVRELAENALHLCALLILAGHMPEARVWAAKSGNRKRQLIAALPGPLARKLLWKSTEARNAPVPTELLDLESYFRT